MMISSLDEWECVDKFCYCETWLVQVEEQKNSKSTLCLGIVHETGSSAIIKESFSQNERKSIQGLYSECLDKKWRLWQDLREPSELWSGGWLVFS